MMADHPSVEVKSLEKILTCCGSLDVINCLTVGDHFLQKAVGSLRYLLAIPKRGVLLLKWTFGYRRGFVYFANQQAAKGQVLGEAHVNVKLLVDLSNKFADFMLDVVAQNLDCYETLSTLIVDVCFPHNAPRAHVVPTTEGNFKHVEVDDEGWLTENISLDAGKWVWTFDAVAQRARESLQHLLFLDWQMRPSDGRLIPRRVRLHEGFSYSSRHGDYIANDWHIDSMISTFPSLRTVYLPCKLSYKGARVVERVELLRTSNQDLLLPGTSNRLWHDLLPFSSYIEVRNDRDYFLVVSADEENRYRFRTFRHAIVDQQVNSWSEKNRCFRALNAHHHHHRGRMSPYPYGWYDSMRLSFRRLEQAAQTISRMWQVERRLFGIWNVVNGISDFKQESRKLPQRLKLVVSKDDFFRFDFAQFGKLFSTLLEQAERDGFKISLYVSDDRSNLYVTSLDLFSNLLPLLHATAPSRSHLYYQVSVGMFTVSPRTTFPNSKGVFGECRPEKCIRTAFERMSDRTKRAISDFCDSIGKTELMPPLLPSIKFVHINKELEYRDSVTSDDKAKFMQELEEQILDAFTALVRDAVDARKQNRRDDVRNLFYSNITCYEYYVEDHRWCHFSELAETIYAGRIRQIKEYLACIALGKFNFGRSDCTQTLMNLTKSSHPETLWSRACCDADADEAGHITENGWDTVSGNANNAHECTQQFAGCMPLPKLKSIKIKVRIGTSSPMMGEEDDNAGELSSDEDNDNDGEDESEPESDEESPFGEEDNGDCVERNADDG